MRYKWTYLSLDKSSSLTEFHTATKLSLPVFSPLHVRNQEIVLKSGQVLVSQLGCCQGSKRPGHICESLGSTFASAHNSLQSEIQKCDSLALLPLGHRFECLIKGCFLTTCLHPACMHALAWCFCNFYVASVLESKGANKALIQIAVRTAGSCSCRFLTSPAVWSYYS